MSREDFYLTQIKKSTRPFSFGMYCNVYFSHTLCVVFYTMSPLLIGLLVVC